MADLLTLDVIDNGQGGHRDLLFCIPDLIDDKKFDTYYFYLAVDPVETIGDIKKAVSRLLQLRIHCKPIESGRLLQANNRL